MGGSALLLAAIEAMQGGRLGPVKAIVVVPGPGHLQSLPLIARLFRLPLAGPLFITLYAPKALVRAGCGPPTTTRGWWTGTPGGHWWKPAASSYLPTATRSAPATASFLWGRQDRVAPLWQGEPPGKAIPFPGRGSRSSRIAGTPPRRRKPGPPSSSSRGFSPRSLLSEADLG